jgi:hypothetical protein
VKSALAEVTEMKIPQEKSFGINWNVVLTTAVIPTFSILGFLLFFCTLIGLVDVLV